MALTLDEAKALLATCVRSELRDHYFGDAEVYWEKDGAEIAVGYFGETAQIVFEGAARFDGDEARELRRCGTKGTYERNDSTGPDTYRGS